MARAAALTLAQLQARRAAFDMIKAQRPLTHAERIDADRLDQRFYIRVWRAQQAEVERRSASKVQAHG